MPAPTPASGLLNAKPCLMCLSEKELKAIIVHAMRTVAGLTLAQTNLNAACYGCPSKKQMLAILTELITNQLVPGVSVHDLLKEVRCSACGSEKQIEAAMLYLFSNYFQAIPV